MLPPRIDPELVARRIGPYADREETLAERGNVYQELLGFVPPRIEARLNVTGALDPAMLDLQEKIRGHGMYPKCFDIKTSQLMLFGMLLMDLNDAAPLHAIAARRAGASFSRAASVRISRAPSASSTKAGFLAPVKCCCTHWSACSAIPFARPPISSSVR